MSSAQIGVRLSVTVTVAAAIAAAGLLQGCGASAIGTHARVAQGIGLSLGGAMDVATSARAAELDRIERETEGQPGPERVAALRAEAENWQPVAHALDVTRGVLSSYVEAIALAHAVDNGDPTPQLISLAARLVSLWDPLVRLLGDAGITLAPLPDELAAIVGGQ